MSTDETAEEARLTGLLTDCSERVTELEHQLAVLQAEKANEEWAARVSAGFRAGWRRDEAERKVLAVYTQAVSEHRDTIEEARRIVVTLRPTFNVTMGELAAALVAIDEAMRDLTGEVGMS